MSDPESLAPASGAAAPGSPGAPPATGLFLVDKPAGPTSHDVVQQLRRWTGIRRVGHGGTLDPMATGLLPIFVGRGTRLIEYLGEHRKHYRATIRLGVRTDTDDAEGAVVAEAPVPPLSAGQIEQALAAFRGAVTQVPPAFSAVKVGGVTAHRAARRGEPVEMAAREVTVHTLTVEDWQSPLLRVALSVEHRHLRPRDRPRPGGAVGLRRPRDRDAAHRHWSGRRRAGAQPRGHRGGLRRRPRLGSGRAPGALLRALAAGHPQRGAARQAAQRAGRAPAGGRDGGRTTDARAGPSTGWGRPSRCSSPKPAGPSAGGRRRS